MVKTNYKLNMMLGFLFKKFFYKWGLKCVALSFAFAYIVPVAFAGSLRFLPSEPKQFDFADQKVLPPTFGAGEFTLELWIKPDSKFPVGLTARGTIDQLINWSDFDPKPYSRGDWWYSGNWLLDGHTRPRGFSQGDTREGTFSLQFYGGGRLRWMFADSGTEIPVGKVWAAQAYPASTTPSLLDGKWHHVACVRRWIEETGAQLELWIDGRLIATEKIPQRVNMRKFWDQLPHPDNPKNLGGWSWGSEVMTSWNFFFTQYEDYKGLMDELRFYDRAKSADELANRWTETVTGGEKGLVGYFPMNEGKGKLTRDKLDQSRVITLHKLSKESWSKENAPVKQTGR
jgi:hypothetical protein